jgi:hypothetical protein
MQKGFAGFHLELISCLLSLPSFLACLKPAILTSAA